MKFIITILCSLTLNLSAQELDTHLSAFTPLLGKTWVAEGAWGNGNVFKQEISFNADLGGKIIETISFGFTNEEQTTWGKRNHGIRKWDAEENVLKFWEFDTFGGMTEGTITVNGKDIYYHYNYGGTDITDAWIWKNSNTYTLIVGNYKEGKWEQVYLETETHSLPKYSGPRKDLDALLKGMSDFSETYVKGDHLGISEFYTNDGKIMPSGSKIIKGREDIAARWKLAEGSMVLYHKITPEEVNIMGDTAYDYGYYEGRSQTKGKDAVDWRGKYVIIWKKIDGQWLIDIDIWNRVND